MAFSASSKTAAFRPECDQLSWGMLLKAHALSLVFLDQMCLPFRAALQADTLVISSWLGAS